MKKNHMKRRLASGASALGAWAVLGSEATLGAAARLGYDWILVDCEHGLASLEDAIRILPVAAGHEATCIVRVPTANDAGVFKRVLDMGFEGVLVPQIRDAREVGEVVSACRYPPVGTRGIAGERAHAYGLEFAEYIERANDETIVLVQIETAEAVENIDEIVAVNGLDGVLIGPNDLSNALGVPFQLDSDAFVAAAARVREAARAVGKPAGIYCSTPAQARARLDEGFRFVNLCNDQSLVVRGLRHSIEEMGS